MAEEGEDMKATLEQVKAKLGELKPDTPENDLVAWVDSVRVLCRKPEYRNMLRKEERLWEHLCACVENEKLSCVTLVTVVSAFANLVVDDDDQFVACTHACNSKLLRAIEARAVASLGKANESKLQFVISIALTNFAMQLVEPAPMPALPSQIQQDEEKVEKWEQEKESCEKILALVMKQENSPVPVVMSLALKGENKMIKKSAFGLIGKLGEFSLARKQIVSSDEFENVLKILCEMIFSDDESQQLAAINTANGVYSHTPPSLSEITSLLNSGALCSFATILRGEHQLDDGKSLTFRENVRIEAIKLLKSLMQRNDEIEEEENEEASVKDQVARSKIIRDCGVVKFALEFLGNRVNSKEAIKASTSSTPSKVVIYLTELVAESMKPISHQTEHIEKLLENRAEEVFVRQTLLCTVAIDSMLEDTLRKRVTDPNADVDRKLILIQAQLRKASLFVLSQFATSEERCLQLVSLEPTDKDLFDGRDKIIPLCGHIVASMGKFDLEATNIACNLLRNMFISDNSREIALKQLKLGQFGSALIDLCSNRNQNTASIAAGITRFVCSSHSLEDLQNAFPESTMAKALNLDLTKIYPTVRVELARALSHAMQTVAKFSKESEPLAKLLLTTEAVSLVAFLLQSKHGILVTEALDALRVLPPALLKVAGKEVKIYLPMDELTDDEEPELTEKDMEALEEALKKLDTLEITEEDVDLSKLDPNRTKGTVIEEEKKRKQAQEQEKRKDNDGEKVEDDVVTITLESRISSFSKQKINLEGQEDDPEAVAKIASSVLEVMKS